MKGKYFREKKRKIFNCLSRYGYENLFSEIWSRSRYEWPIHIKDWKSTNYLCDESLGEW